MSLSTAPQCDNSLVNEFNAYNAARNINSFDIAEKQLNEAISFFQWFIQRAKDKRSVYIGSTSDEFRAAKIRYLTLECFLRNINLYDVEEKIFFEIGLSEYEFLNIVKPEYKRLQKSIKPTKIYAAAAMQKAGVSTKKIAEVLDCTPATIRNWFTLYKQVL